MQRAHPLAPTDLVAFSTAPCFVDSVWQVFAALLAGAPLLAVPLACAASPRRLLTFLAQQGASHVVAVPSMWGPMLRCIEEGAVAAASLSALRLVASSGEPLPPALLRRLRAALPGRTVLNVYGCTEAAADAACLECSALEAGEGARSIVPVGAPISNTVLAIAAAAAAAADDDEDDGAAEAGAAAVRLLPVHQLGEVLIGGASLAAGYLRDPAATAARFVSVPVGQLQGAFAAGGDGGWRRGARGGRVRLFRTGDLGFVDARGALHITGRLGLQVKLHGGPPLCCRSAPVPMHTPPNSCGLGAEAERRESSSRRSPAPRLGFAPVSHHTAQCPLSVGHAIFLFSVFTHAHASPVCRRAR
jgi:non-ribosomal peptide synthetase component F